MNTLLHPITAQLLATWQEATAAALTVLAAFAVARKERNAP